MKDRIAAAIILDAEKRGLLSPGDTVIEATSGNTGISLAMVCAVRGYRFVAVMPDTFSPERRSMIRAFGGKVILTDGSRSGEDVRLAERLATQRGWFFARQFENRSNLLCHRVTTATEIINDFADRPLDYFVSGWGTGGTVSGVGEALKHVRPQTRVIASEPAGAAVLSGGVWRPHGIQGCPRP